MNDMRALPSAELWLQQVFDAKAARQGGIVRRKRCDIERKVGWARFEHEIRRRGYQALENYNQIIIICNAEKVKRII